MSILGTVGMVIGGPTSAGAPGPIGTPGYFAFSRDQESQADEIGMELAVEAGFDPRGIADFLSSLEAHHRLHQGYSRATGYFDSHPATAERAAAAATEAEVLDFTPTFSIRGERREYLELLDGLSIGTPAREGVVIDRRFMHADLGITVRFPPGYEVHNTRAAVVGFSPSRKGLVAFEFEAEGDDVLAAARGYAERAGVRLENLRPLKLGDLDAVRARTVYGGAGGRSPAVITWVAFEGQVYRLTALAQGAGAPDVNALAANFSRSFRALTEDERSEIAAPELSLVEAFSGETLAALSARTDNEWTVSETAIQNGLVVTNSLEDGQIVKISRSVRYPASGEELAEVVIPGEDAVRQADGATPDDPTGSE